MRAQYGDQIVLVAGWVIPRSWYEYSSRLRVQFVTLSVKTVFIKTTKPRELDSLMEI